jgi:hypothetical protein
VGRIGRVVKHEIEKFIQLVVETRKGFNQGALVYNSSGDDSPPVKDDRVILIAVDGTGKYISAGTLTGSQGAKPGEKFLFSRDAAGVLQTIIKMLNDGSIDGAIKKDVILEIKGKYENTVTGELKLETKAKATLKGIDVEINAVNGKITGGKLEVGGTVAPTGNGALCGCKYCYVLGIPVAGNIATGT